MTIITANNNFKFNNCPNNSIILFSKCLYFCCLLYWHILFVLRGLFISIFLCLFISNTVPHCCLCQLCIAFHRFQENVFKKGKNSPFLPVPFRVVTCHSLVLCQSFFIFCLSLLLHLPFIWVPPSVISFLIHFSFPVSTSSDVLFLIPVQFFVCFVLFSRSVLFLI